VNALSRDPSLALDRSYVGDTATLRDARRDVEAWLIACGADENTRERAALIVSELASNALQASPGLTYQLHVSRLDDRIVAISIRNYSSGAGPPDRHSWRPIDALAFRGRGLSIVDSLSEDVTVERLAEEVIITARLHLAFGVVSE
jgi:anti-sigma regulatory factor (Ser/Thr protein kinase)